MLLEFLEEFVEVVLVFCDVPAVDQHVVEVAEHKGKITGYVVHHPLEGGRSIDEAHGHAVVLEEAPRCPGGGVFTVRVFLIGIWWYPFFKSMTLKILQLRSRF